MILPPSSFGSEGPIVTNIVLLNYVDHQDLREASAGGLRQAALRATSPLGNASRLIDPNNPGREQA